MKNLLYLLSIFLVSFSCAPEKLQNGDIIFHTSKTFQSQMIQTLTNSNLSHCGIINYRSGKPYVLEAVNPVKLTPLNQWISRGVAGKYKVVRLKERITDEKKQLMFAYGKRQLGKNYDIKFEWSDKKMYCSEIVWKIYKAAGYDLCTPKTFSYFDLSGRTVRNEIKKRYGATINLKEKVVSPEDLYNSNMVKTIFSNF